MSATFYYVSPAHVTCDEPRPGWYFTDDDLGIEDPRGPFITRTEAREAHDEAESLAAERQWEERNR